MAISNKEREDMVGKAAKDLYAEGKKITNKAVYEEVCKQNPGNDLTLHLVNYYKNFQNIINQYRPATYMQRALTEPLTIGFEHYNVLPVVNTSNNFIFLYSAQNKFKNLWSDFFERLALCIGNENSYSQLSPLNHFIQQHPTLKIVLSFAFNDKFKSSKMSGRYISSIMKSFLFFLHSKKCLLFPASALISGVTFISDSIMPFVIQNGGKDSYYDFISAYCKINKHIHVLSIVLSLSICSKLNFNEYDESDMQLIETTILSNLSSASNEHQKDKLRRYCYECRTFLFHNKANVLSSFSSKKKHRDEKKTDFLKVEYAFKPSSDELVILLDLANKYINKKDKISRVSRQTIEEKKRHLKFFFEYADNKIDFKMDDKYLFECFNYPDDEIHTFQSYILSKNIPSELKGNTINTVFEFMSTCGFANAFPNMHVPKIRRDYKESSRLPLPDSLYDDIVELLLNEPPECPYFWIRERTPIDWWNHQVYPALPLMVYIHMMIPLRGEQIRNLDRDRFLVRDSQNQVIGFYVNTDKNVNALPFVVPNIWSDEIIWIESYIKWHKNYFSNAKKHKYKNDENSPWEEFIPLFFARNETTPITAYTHMNYWKRILATIQIKYNDRGLKMKIAWTKNGSAFFESIDELNSSDDNYVNKNIEVAHDIHSLRMTGATRFVKMGMPLSMIKKFTGHSGLNTLMGIYIKFREDELVSAFKSISGKDLLGVVTNNQTAEQYKNDLIRSISTLDITIINEALLDQGLFIVNPVKTNKGKMQHPSNWKPLAYGLCAGIKCPSGREGKCLSCEDFITGLPYINAIAMQAELSYMRAVWTSDEVIKNRESNRANLNVHLRQKMKYDANEFIGWLNILNEINLSLRSSKDHNATLSESQPTIAFPELITSMPLSRLDGYLNIYSKSKIAEYEPELIENMTNKLVIEILKNIDDGTREEIVDLLGDSKKVIDWFISSRNQRLTLQIKETQNVASLLQ